MFRVAIQTRWKSVKPVAGWTSAAQLYWRWLTMASAWCGYQSALWSGVQTFQLAAVSTAGGEAAAQSMKALELRGLDASMLINYVEAEGRGDTSQEDFLYQQLHPEMPNAVDAWLKT